MKYALTAGFHYLSVIVFLLWCGLVLFAILAEIYLYLPWRKERSIWIVLNEAVKVLISAPVLGFVLALINLGIAESTKSRQPMDSHTFQEIKRGTAYYYHWMYPYLAPFLYGCVAAIFGTGLLLGLMEKLGRKHEWTTLLPPKPRE